MANGNCMKKEEAGCYFFLKSEILIMKHFHTRKITKKEEKTSCGQ